MTTTENPAIENGATVFIPLNKLKKHPKNARRTPHSEASIESKAASIAAKGILQNLVVEPELDPEGQPTGFYLVTIGEGRRLAQMLRVKRKEIKKNEPIRCMIDTANDAAEISLDENVTREAMHPADQFEAFKELAESRGWDAEEIAARFGVTAHVVKQRLRLGAVSPRLMQEYREGRLKLEQLMAFTITEDHARQEQVYDSLSYNCEPWIIRRDLTASHVAATDRRAIFVGPEAYIEAGGAIIRDLFTEDRGGFFEDAGLLDRLTLAKLEAVAAEVQAEGWKWGAAHIDFPHAHGMGRATMQPVELSAEDEAALAALQEEYGLLTNEWEGADEIPEDVQARLEVVESEMERIEALRFAYLPEDIARCGVFVSLWQDGTARIERGFVRAEDEQPEPEAVEPVEGEEGSGEPEGETEDEQEDARKPLSDALVRDLTANRTLALRVALGEQPDMALIAVTHALASRLFYRYADASCLEIRPGSGELGGHAPGIEDTVAAKTLADRHGAWQADMPQDSADLWSFIARLDQASVMALLAHCASLTVNAVEIGGDRNSTTRKNAGTLATAVALDMASFWTPTSRTYLGRVTKGHILDAVREGVSTEAATRIEGLKKQAMAETAEQLLAGTGWLPPVLRTVGPAWLTEAPAEQDEPLRMAAE